MSELYRVPTRVRNVATASTERGMTVNAAFLQEIKDDNRHLSELLEALAQVLSRIPHRRIRPTVLVDLLRRLRDQLAMHFALEEAFGYFDDAVDIPTHLSSQADILRCQHDTLFVELGVIVEEAEQVQYGEKNGRAATNIHRIAIAFSTFYRKLKDHEESERDLITQALYEDLGDGD